MRIWLGIGEFFSRHMTWITTAAVAAGILFPAQFSWLAPFVPWMFAVVTFQGALGNTVATVGEVLRRPALLIAVLAASSIAMPVLAWTVAQMRFGSDAEILAGIVLEFSVPVAVVSVMWCGIGGGNTALSIVAVLVSTLLSPVTLPAMVELLMGARVEVDALDLFRSMLLMVALPALAGVGVNEATHGWGAETLSALLAPAAKILITLILASNATAIADYMRHLTPQLIRVLILVLAVAVLGYVLGIALGRRLGSGHSDTVAACLAVGMRNISAGAVIAARFFGPATMFPVVAGTLFQQLLASAFSRYLEREAAGE